MRLYIPQNKDDRRAGILFVHGGGWMICSIGKALIVFCHLTFSSFLLYLEKHSKLTVEFKIILMLKLCLKCCQCQGVKTRQQRWLVELLNGGFQLKVVFIFFVVIYFANWYFNIYSFPFRDARSHCLRNCKKIECHGCFRRVSE